MNFSNYRLVHILIVPILFSLILYNSNFSGERDKNDNEYSFISLNFLQNSYAIESDEKDENNDNNDSKETKEENDETENNNGKSIFNIVAVGDWDCTSETEDTVDNIIKQDPELVLAIGDFSYSGDADCWFELIEPIADKTKIVMGNHEDEDDYMDFFGLKEQYYSFNQKNVHFLALSTETCL